MSASLVAPEAPAATLREILVRFWPYCRPRRWQMLLALGFAAIEPAIATAEIWLFKLVVDDVLVAKDFGPFWPIAGAYVGLTVLAGIIAGLSRMLDTWLTQRFLIDLRVAVLHHVQRLPLEFFGVCRQGDLQSRVTHDVSAIEGFLVSGSTAMVSYGLEVVLFTAALFYLDWRLALVALIVTPLFATLTKAFSRRIKQISREKQRRVGATNSSLEQTLSTIALVQAYDRTESEVARFTEQAEARYRTEMASAKVRSLFAPLLELTELAGVLIVLAVGTWLLTRGDLTVGELLVFITYLTRLYSPIRGLGSTFTAAHSAAAGAERVIELLDEPPLPEDHPNAVELGRARGELGLDNVSVRYPGASRDALSGVDLVVRPGEVVAVVGPSGAGKSTLVRLVNRSLDPGAGRVTMDGHDLRELTRASVRRNVALLLQQTQLVDGSIGDNIAFGVDAAEEEAVHVAALRAGVLDFAAELPEGMDTQVGEKGRRLSGGQAQRVAIARALLRDAPVLVLDEPTTGLDRAAADRLQPILSRLMADRATLVISHDLTRVADVDRVVVLEGGRVIESGSPAELLAAGGWYAAALAAAVDTAAVDTTAVNTTAVNTTEQEGLAV
ncbi:MAG: ABC transporter ATP-binding protein [Nocardioides sp.]